MWIMLNDAFLSVVENDADKSGSTLLVRARIPGDIERAFADGVSGELLDIVELPRVKRDYRYRCVLPRGIVAQAIAARITGIKYPDFKSSIKDNERHNVMLSLWVKLKAWQNKIERPVAKLAEDDGFADEAAQLGLYEPPTWWKARPTPFLKGASAAATHPEIPEGAVVMTHAEAQAALLDDAEQRRANHGLKPFFRRPKETATLLNGMIEVVLTCGHSFLTEHRPSGKQWRKGILCRRCMDEDHEQRERRRRG